MLVEPAPGGAVEVTLRRPVPLATPLAVAEHGDGAVELSAGGELVMAARPVAAPDGAPPVVDVAGARAAADPVAWADGHPFPTCFGCGPQRDPADALCLYRRGRGRRRPLRGALGAGGVGGRRAASSRPSSSGRRWTARAPPRRRGRLPVVLGRFTVAFSPAPVRIGEEYVVESWLEDGRGPQAPHRRVPARRRGHGPRSRPRDLDRPAGMSEVTARRTTGEDPDARLLVAAMTAETGALYGGPPPAGSSATPGELSPPAGGFVVLERDGRALAGGGLKRSEAGICEIKRMFVVPEARGSGLGARLLEELEALARDLGYAVARLDTGAKQPGAQRLYERAGYRAIADFNGDAHAAWWGEKPLSRP